LIGGDGVAKGYLHAPDLTVQRFIDNPFVRSGGKVYKTGF
jgi:fengycin family lipopeptide synthetase E